MVRNILVIFLLSLNVAFSQGPKTGQVSGKIVDASNGEVLPFATIGFFQSKNTKDSLVAGMTVPITGEFLFTNLPLGKLIAKISFVGYQSVSQVVEVGQQMVDLKSIRLNPDVKLLQEVQVKGEKDQVSFGMDKRVFNVAKSITSVGGTAEALLRTVPSINVDESGNASLRNMATTIYVNGKPTQLTLAQIPANQIESVEVISNPSARYEASTSGGIVNLVLKKNRATGFNGSVSAGIGNNSRYDGSLNVDYHQGKWNFTGLYNLNATQNPLNGYVNRTSFLNGLPQSYFNQNTLTTLDNTFQNGRIVVDYAANQYHTFSLAGTIVSGAFNQEANQQYEYKNAQQVITSFGTRTTLPANSYTNVGLEFDWKKTFARKGRELSFISSFTRNQVSNASDWFTTAKNADGSDQPAYPEVNVIAGRQIGSQYLAQIDYVHPKNDSTKFEMGFRSYTFGRDIQYFFNQQNNDTKAFNLLPTYSQDAEILETVNALYFLYNHRLKHHITMEAGLRIEQSFLHGTSRFDNSTFGYDYPTADGKGWFQSFFPSFSLNKKLNEDSEFGLSLSRKVGRPGFRQLFIGVQANDRQNITVGNPKIQPEFVNTAELNYSQSIGRLSWLASAYYIYEDNTIKPFTQPSETDPSILVTSFINAKADIQYGMDNTFKYTAGAFSATANINVFNFIVQTETITNEAVVYRAKLNMSYRFPANISVNINVNRDSKSPSLQGFRLPIQAADFAIRKSFMNNRASVVFTANDIFNSRKQISTIEQTEIYQESMNRREVRFYKLTLQLPLGKANATFRKKERKMEKTDIDFGN